MEDELRHFFLAGLDGDAKAYHRFLVRLAPALRRYFRGRVQHFAHDIEDLVQETLLAVHQQRHTYRRHALLGPWVYAIARYKLIDALRAQGRRVSATESIDDLSEWLSDPHTEIDETRRDLHQLIEQLPASQRVPLQHTKLQGLSVAESAELTGRSEAAIKVGIHRGLKTLARLWKEHS